MKLQILCGSAFVLAIQLSIVAGQQSNDVSACSALFKSVSPEAGLESKDHCGAAFGHTKNYLPFLAQITNMLIGNNFEYMQLASYFARDTINWDGFQAYFEDLSNEAWERAIDLIKYANLRGHNIGPKVEVTMQQKRKYDMSEGEALGFALDREKSTLKTVTSLLKNTAGIGSDSRATYTEPLLNHFVENKFASDGSKTVREISGLVHNLHSMSNEQEYPLAVFHMNKVLKNLAGNE